MAEPLPPDPTAAEPPATSADGMPRSAAARPLSFVQTIQAVAWSFFGVRRKRDYERDVARLNPVHLILAGFIGAALFVAVLVLLVQWVVAGSTG